MITAVAQPFATAGELRQLIECFTDECPVYAAFEAATLTLRYEGDVKKGGWLVIATAPADPAGDV